MKKIIPFLPIIGIVVILTNKYDLKELGIDLYTNPLKFLLVSFSQAISICLLLEVTVLK